ncbi:MAG: hypothetical protein ABJO36_04795 [Litorimonas sp.]
MKRILVPILCSSLFAPLAVADDHDPAEVRNEYNACATLLSDDQLSGEQEAKCKIYVRAYEGGHSNGYEKAREDILTFRGMPPYPSEEGVAGGFVGHTGNWEQFVASNPQIGWKGREEELMSLYLQNRNSAETPIPATGIGAIQIDPKVLEAAKLKFEKLPSGDYALVGE